MKERKENLEKEGREEEEVEKKIRTNIQH